MFIYFVAPGSTVQYTWNERLSRPSKRTTMDIYFFMVSARIGQSNAENVWEMGSLGGIRDTSNPEGRCGGVGEMMRWHPAILIICPGWHDRGHDDRTGQRPSMCRIEVPNDISENGQKTVLVPVWFDLWNRLLHIVQRSGCLYFWVTKLHSQITVISNYYSMPEWAWVFLGFFLMGAITGCAEVKAHRLNSDLLMISS